MTNVLSVINLTKTYTEAGQKITVLEDVNLNIKVKETLAIVGASGVGKTTFLQLLGGLDTPTSGQVQLMGKNFSHEGEKRKAKLRNLHLGFVYQFHHLMPEFNAFENVCIPLLIRGEALKTVREKALYYIDQVGLGQRLHHRVGELSGGERQRIAIARALVSEPNCVLADEPTGNLDENTALRITELLLSLNEKLATTFVIVTHNKLLAQRMQRVLTVINGQLIEERRST